MTGKRQLLSFLRNEAFLRMAIVIGIIILLLLTASLKEHTYEAEAEPTPSPSITPKPIDWKEILIQAAAAGDRETGITAQTELGGDLLYEDLFLLAKIIANECGPAWEDWGIMAIGEVVLNRVDSPEFPGTVREVLYQTNPIQYEPVWLDGWESYIPPEKYVRLALRLLEGERPLGDPTIVFQALFTQGSGVALTYHDDILQNDTYFCWTSYPEFYARG